jgi:hypothetical protein
VHLQQSRLDHVTMDIVANPPDAAFTPADPPQFSSRSETRDMAANHAPVEFGPGRADTTPEVMHGRNRSPQTLGTNSIAAEAAEPAWAPDIENHHRNELLDDRQGLRVWLIGAALMTAFCLGWAGGSNSDRFLGVDADSNSGAQSLSPEMPAVSAKSDKPANVTSHSAPPETPKPPKTPGSGARTLEQTRTPSADPPRSISPSSNPIASLLHDSSAALGPAAVRAPVPETRPATIAGWTVLAVQGGRATLEGPGGIWKAATGDIVPGVGLIHSIVRWGSNWVVATDKGLIATR